ncbi:Cell division protein FtsI [Peptidoglycan synthetase] [hydrothermal vent metagenome]|uniref:Cell division protein FtsI [Peptidoglycan synthetase] n=1 Tax=hydrothermal vent metagenome TaxID=652676 RepID=A0A3B0TBT3_9ZZZZ
MFLRKAKKAKPAAYVITEAETAASLRPETAPATRHVRARSGRQRQTERAKTRILMCAVVFVFVFASLGVRLAFISFGQIKAEAPRATAPSIEAPRAEITDRNGALLATDLPMISLEVAGREIWDARETAQKLLSVLPDIDAVELEQKLRRGRYVDLRGNLTPAERQAVFDLGLPGIHFATRIKRFYPQADLAAHVVGHEEPGKGGVMGLEKVANDWRGGRTMRASIDIRVQQIVEDELAAAITKFSAKAGWAGVMDVATGEVIALASLPDFDPNAPGAAAADSRRNRATLDQYELGSAFKAFTAAAALEEGLAGEATNYDARGSFFVADHEVTDFHGENRILTLSEVVQYSSNIGIARVAGDLGSKRQREYLGKLGLLTRLTMELPERRAPGLPERWGPVETATIAYGHGISVTPLHLLTAFCAVVNGGEFHDPTFFAEPKRVSARAVFSNQTSAVMRRILRRVITDGTASQAEAPGYFPIGKTATADKPLNGGYDRNTRIASFVGAVPGYAPRYAILVSLDEPQPLKETYGYATAGWTAAPVFSRIVARAAPFLGLTPVNEATALAGFVSGDQTADTPRKAAASAPIVERAP